MSWTLNGTPISAGRLSHAAAGNWWAHVLTLDDTAPGGAAVLALPGLTLRGTVIWSGISAGRCMARVVGGAGKLADIIPGQSFQGASGQLVAEMLLSAAGEVYDPASDAPALSGILTAWSYFGGVAVAALDRLCAALGCTWWVTAEGLIHLGTPTWTDAAPDGALTLEDREDLRRLLVALEDAPVVPGTTYEGRKVVSVDHELTPETWRAHVRYSA